MGENIKNHELKNLRSVSNCPVRAIIGAAGRGNRFGADLPKQFCDFRGRPLLMSTIEKFVDTISFNNILLVIDHSMESLWLEMCKKHQFVSPKIVYGGKTRAESVKAAVEKLDCNDQTIVMVHDGARPLLSPSLIKRMTTLPEGAVGAVPVVALTDSIRQITEEKSSIPVDRSKYACVQTPQSFSAGILREAYSTLPSDNSITDDASAVERRQLGEIALVEGEATNIKITNPMDMAIAEAIMNQLEEANCKTTDCER